MCRPQYCLGPAVDAPLSGRSGGVGVPFGLLHAQYVFGGFDTTSPETGVNALAYLTAAGENVPALAAAIAHTSGIDIARFVAPKGDFASSLGIAPDEL